MAKKIEGYCQRHDSQEYLDIGNTVFVNRTPRTSKDPLCTIVVHEGKPERVFTESEVRAMLKAVRDELEANCRWQSGVEVVSASAMRQALFQALSNPAMRPQQQRT